MAFCGRAPREGDHSHSGPLPLREIEPRLAEAPFVSVCGLVNLPVLNRLYGPGLGDLAAEALVASRRAR